MTPQPPGDPRLKAALDELAELVVEDVLSEEGDEQEDSEAA